MIGCKKLEIHRWSRTTGEFSLIVLHFGGKQASSEDGDLRLGGEEPKEVGVDNGEVYLPDFSLLLQASEMARLVQKDPIHCSGGKLTVHRDLLRSVQIHSHLLNCPNPLPVGHIR